MFIINIYRYMTISTAVYIGAGFDIRLVKSFSNKFQGLILVDSLPLNEHGLNYYDRDFYRKYFIEKLQKKFKKYDFSLQSHEKLTDNFSEINCDHLESAVWLFTNNDNDMFVKYYTSTCIPHHLKFSLNSLENDLSNADTLIIKGHHPNKEVLKYMKKPIHLICDLGTGYCKDLEEYEEEEIPNEEYSVLRKILKKPYYNDIIAKISLYNGEKDEMESFTNYEDFYKAYLSIKSVESE